MLEELYKEYGELIIKTKIINERIVRIEKQVIEEMNRIELDKKKDK